jgi:hypothetical protein
VQPPATISDKGFGVETWELLLDTVIFGLSLILRLYIAIQFLGVRKSDTYSQKTIGIQ